MKQKINERKQNAEVVKETQFEFHTRDKTLREGKKCETRGINWSFVCISIIEL